MKIYRNVCFLKIFQIQKINPEKQNYTKIFMLAFILRNFTSAVMTSNSRITPVAHDIMCVEKLLKEE